MVAKDLDINEFYWGLKTKFKLEIGLTNDFNPTYPDIIWFPQGMYVITSFNTSQSANNYSISVTGKDKMCLLNGELGGHLPASIDFGTEEIVQEDGTVLVNKIPVKKIIREALHTYALEPYHNIIINNLDGAGLELLEYRGEDPLYLMYDMTQQAFTNIYRKPVKCYIKNGSISNLDEIEHMNMMDKMIAERGAEVILSPDDETVYKVAKIEFGMAAGYRITELTYSGDLISSIGEALTAILDKIKGMLGEFEYFYDLQGRFVFQKKKTYINQPFNNEQNNDDDRFIDNFAYGDKIAYKFDGGNLITSFQNSPNLTNLRNDYSIWGVRKALSGSSEGIPVHLRYAIDIKPEKYTSISGTLYSADKVDWRELIYRMAEDYYKHNQEDDFAQKIAEANSALGLYLNGSTGYEQYYVDIFSFWRELYNPDNAEWKEGWSPTISNSPDLLNFWFDFLESGELDQFSVSAIGDRTKVINDNNVKSIYFRDVPEVLYINNPDEEIELIKSSNYYHFTRLYNLPKTLFSISAQGKSAYDELENLLYQHSYCSESVTIQSIPVYYLEPNTRIYIKDESSNIDGEYIISRLTLPLTYNGTMSISATKAPISLY